MIRIIPAAFGTPAFASCLDIRMDVFVNEQNVPAEEELDEFDTAAIHILALVDDQAVGTARAVEKMQGLWKIGRVAVRAAYRGQGIGAALMRSIETACPANHFILSAQTHALRFYEQLGYKAEGAEFIDAGIAHRIMRKGGSAL